MAIIKGIPGLEVTIQVDGQSLPEYDDPHAKFCDDDDLEVLATVTKEKDSVSITARQVPHVVKYIEATPGKEFGARLTQNPYFDHRCDHLGFVLETDGISTTIYHERFTIWKREWEDTLTNMVYYTKGVGWRKRNYKFNHLKIIPTDQCTKEKISEDLVSSKSLGTLRILVYRMEFSPTLPTPLTKAYEQRENISEKALKGRALYAIAGSGDEMRTITPISWSGWKCQDPDQRPYAIFEFRYRTKKGLIEELIIPRPTRIDAMSDEEVREYARKVYLEREKCTEDQFDLEAKKEQAVPDSSSKRRGTFEDTLLRKRYKNTTRGDDDTLVHLRD